MNRQKLVCALRGHIPIWQARLIPVWIDRVLYIKQHYVICKRCRAIQEFGPAEIHFQSEDDRANRLVQVKRVIGG